MVHHALSYSSVARICLLSPRAIGVVSYIVQTRGVRGADSE